jgi:hypothetical protein
MPGMSVGCKQLQAGHETITLANTVDIAGTEREQETIAGSKVQAGREG